jgi:phosphopantothenoylcysteine decarboxylase/phosphopantothenate--cysteine ligase
VIFAPAMNTNMYENPIVQDNIKKLKSFGYDFIGPIEGRLACGTTGAGKFENPEVIVDRVLMELNDKKDLINKNVIVTAGPTIAPIDPVRFITNRSTGKMGYAIAKEARNRGANVTLISGPTSIEVPKNINVIRVSTNEEMKNEVIKRFDNADIVIKSAAVADYKPKNYSTQKIKKGEGDLGIEFIRDNDILMELGNIKENQILVGFAAESQNLKENAMSKLQRKNLDYIVANDITSSDTGFGSEDNKVIILSKENEEIHLDKMSKEKIASNLFDIILEKR